MSEIRVGRFRIIHCVSYLHIAGEDAFLEFDVFSDKASFRVEFLVSDESEVRDKTQFASGTDPQSYERGLLTFTNWNRGSFKSIAPPSLVAIIDRRNIYLLYGVSYSNDVYQVHLQFMEDLSEGGGEGAE